MTEEEKAESVEEARRKGADPDVHRRQLEAMERRKKVDYRGVYRR